MTIIGIVGAAGYSGAELVRLLAGHPDAPTLRLFGSERTANQKWADVAPAYAQYFSGTLEAFEPAAFAGFDAAFVALPHGEAGAAAVALTEYVGTVIDLSGDLRLRDAATYEKWYRQAPPAPEWLGKAVYGQPELFAEEIAGAKLIANPGCYATAAILAMAPALAAKHLVGDDVVITAVSGSSGAGKKAKSELLLAELGENMRAYRIGDHQHVPEILQAIETKTGRSPRLTFVPQIGPFVRGILLVATFPLTGETNLDGDGALAILRDFYAGAECVRVVAHSPELRHVVGTNFCDLTARVDAIGQRLVIVAAIDNLVKGAAGQAIQNLNLVRRRPCALGLVR